MDVLFLVKTGKSDTNFVLQASPDYLSFYDSFALVLDDKVPLPVTLAEGTRNTLVMIKDEPSPRPLQVTNVSLLHYKHVSFK